GAHETQRGPLPSRRAHPCSPAGSGGGVEVGGAQRSGDGAGDALELLHLVLEVLGDVLQLAEAQTRERTADDPAARLGGAEAVEAVAVELGEGLERLVDLAEAVRGRAREDRVQQQELDRSGD